jgi:prepilin-type N-terminal cleavage/methylation domain-containing protein
MYRPAMVRLRGFSLIEVMVVVAIIGVMAALAGPSLLFEVQKAKLQASTDTIAAFLLRAQTEAMVSRRCVRVRVTSPQVLVADRLDTFDCDNDPVSASRISTSAAPAAANLFVPVNTLNLDSPSVAVTFDNTLDSQVPNECDPAPGGAGNELRFRPNGRVFSNDGVNTNDDAIFVVTHGGIGNTGNKNRQKILVNGNGLMCVLKRGHEPTGSAPDFSCPL